MKTSRSIWIWLMKIIIDKTRKATNSFQSRQWMSITTIFLRLKLTKIESLISTRKTSKAYIRWTIKNWNRSYLIITEQTIFKMHWNQAISQKPWKLKRKISWTQRRNLFSVRKLKKFKNTFQVIEILCRNWVQLLLYKINWFMKNKKQ